MENLNLAELLKDCPKGMKLYSPIFGDVYLDKIRPHLAIVVTTDKEQGNLKEEFLYDGRYGMNGECMLFPSKGKTTWEGFVPPIEFKDGDVLYVDCTDENDNKQYDYIFILDKIYNGKVYSCCLYYIPDDDFRANLPVGTHLTDDKYPIRFATEEEKQKLFDAIKANGYKWNAETKTLEKLIKPIFEVGNKIEKCGYRFTIAEVKDEYYLTKCGNKIPIDNQDDFSLVPNKFDITTLKPFESRVLVRDYDYRMWIPTFWGKRLEDDSNCSYLTTNGCYKYCIPCEGNEHLLGTTNDCDDFYKTWEK